MQNKLQEIGSLFILTTYKIWKKKPYGKGLKEFTCQSDQNNCLYLMIRKFTIMMFCTYCRKYFVSIVSVILTWKIKFCSARKVHGSFDLEASNYISNLPIYFLIDLELKMPKSLLANCLSATRNRFLYRPLFHLNILMNSSICTENLVQNALCQYNLLQ